MSPLLRMKRRRLLQRIQNAPRQTRIARLQTALPLRPRRRVRIRAWRRPGSRFRQRRVDIIKPDFVVIRPDRIGVVRGLAEAMPFEESVDGHPMHVRAAVVHDVVLDPVVDLHDEIVHAQTVHRGHFEGGDDRG